MSRVWIVKLALVAVFALVIAHNALLLLVG